MYRPIVTIAAAAVLLAGCSAPAQPASLRESCDALAPVLAEFGQQAPDAARYAATLPKVQAIQAAGDQSTKDALQPYVDVLARGAKGEPALGVLADQAAASIKLAMACGAAGSSLMPASASASPSSSPTPTATPLPADDFHAVVEEVDRTCTGDSCTVDARVGVGYVGVDDFDDRALVTVTVTGGDEPETRPVVVDGDEVTTFETTATVPRGTKLRVSVDRAESS